MIFATWKTTSSTNTTFPGCKYHAVMAAFNKPTFVLLLLALFTTAYIISSKIDTFARIHWVTLLTCYLRKCQNNIELPTVTMILIISSFSAGHFNVLHVQFRAIVTEIIKTLLLLQIDKQKEYKYRELDTNTITYL